MTDALLDAMQAAAPHFQFPPPCFTEMSGEFVDYEEGKSLTVRFPFDTRYANPSGVMLGGFVAAAVDNALGPLSFLVAPPSVTTQLNLTYLRPVSPNLEYYEVEARLDERTRQYLFMSARVTDPTGRVLVLAQATCYILPRRGKED